LIQWKPFAPWLTAVLAIAMGAYYQHSHNQQLAEARAETYVAVEAYQEARQQALAAEILAATAQSRADSIEQARVVAAPRVAAIVKAAPDTCKPVIAALQGQLAQAESELQARKDAFTEQKQATAILAPAADRVADAATNLANKSKPSFWSKVKPDVGLGATIGLDPEHPTDGVKKVVGVTVSWKVL
jgi:hypothetical protein